MCQNFMNKKIYFSLFMYLLVYTGTCLFGALAFLLDKNFFKELYTYFSGTLLPSSYTVAQLELIFFLLIVPPVCFVVSGFLGGAAWFKTTRVTNIDKFFSKFPTSNLPNKLLVRGFGFLSILIGLISFYRGGALSNFLSWLSYDDWLLSRWTLFHKLTFLEFVNIYSIVPVCCVLLFFLEDTGSSASRNRKWRYFLLFIPFLFSLLLFQKKMFVINFIFISSVFYFKSAISFTVTVKKFIQMFLLISLLFSLIAFLPTILSKNNNEIKRNLKSIELREKFFGKDILPLTEYILDNEILNKSTYLIMTPLTRTSSAAIYYSLVFPTKHQFYGFNLPFDGITQDDNYVVWNEMNPNFQGGTAMAPAQFVVYSQIGRYGALCFLSLIGFFIFYFYGIFSRFFAGSVYDYVVSALLVVFHINLAMDSFKNSFIVSYGVFWPLLFVFFIVGLSILIEKKAS